MESLGVYVGDIRSSVMRMDIGKARQGARVSTSSVQVAYYASLQMRQGNGCA